MESIIINVKDKGDSALFFSLAKRLKLNARFLTESEKEDYALSLAIDEGRKSGYVTEEEVMKVLKRKKKH